MEKIRFSEWLKDIFYAAPIESDNQEITHFVAQAHSLAVSSMKSLCMSFFID